MELKEDGAWFVGIAIALIGSLFGIAGGLIAWFTRRDVRRYDDGLTRIAKLEANSVTHDQLDVLLTRMSAERAVMHQENQAGMRLISDKMDMFEERRSKTEHSIRNNVNALNLKIAVIAAKGGINLPSNNGADDDEG